MSGLFGVVDPTHKTDVRALADQMAIEMSHRDWYHANQYINDNHTLAVGRIGIGIFNSNPQPVFDDERKIFVFMTGEIYNSEDLTADSRSISDEDLVLRLYRQKGKDFISDIKGIFLIAIVDLTTNQLLIINDRFGLYPLFYSYRAGRFVFAPEMKGILCDELFPVKIDYTALAQYVRFQQLLGSRTFFEDIVLLSPATILTYDFASGSCFTNNYWSYNDIQLNSHISINEAVEESARLISKSVKIRSNGDYRPGVYLSGGLDSRTILGLIDYRPVASVTYGRHDCRDVIYANQIAKKTGSNHFWIDFQNGNWITENFNFHLDLTEGYHSWIHAHGISTLGIAKGAMDVNLTGFGGGTVMGKHFIEPKLYAAVDDFALTTYLFYKFNQKYTWPSINEAEENMLYSTPVGNKLRGIAYESFCEELKPFLSYRPDIKSELFYLSNHERRLIINYITFTRSHLEVRIPFYDYDLIDFMYSLPADYRMDQRMFRPVMQKIIPELSYIPYERDELLPTTNTLIRSGHAALVKFKRRFNRHIYKIFPEYFTLYADYENYLRQELRNWAEDILFDNITASRELFNPIYLKSLMNRHLSGMEEATIGKIAPLITYEMMLRRFYD